MDGVKKDNNTNKDSGGSMNGKDRTASSSDDINKTHIKSRLQHLQSELSSVLHSLRSPPDEVVTSKVICLTRRHLETFFYPTRSNPISDCHLAYFLFMISFRIVR